MNLLLRALVPDDRILCSSKPFHWKIVHTSKMGIADTIAESIFPPIVNAHHLCHLSLIIVIIIMASGIPGKMIQTLGLLCCLDNLRQNIK